MRNHPERYLVPLKTFFVTDEVVEYEDTKGAKADYAPDDRRGLLAAVSMASIRLKGSAKDVGPREIVNAAEHGLNASLNRYVWNNLA